MLDQVWWDGWWWFRIKITPRIISKRDFFRTGLADGGPKSEGPTLASPVFGTQWEAIHGLQPWGLAPKVTAWGRYNDQMLVIFWWHQRSFCFMFNIHGYSVMDCPLLSVLLTNQIFESDMELWTTPPALLPDHSSRTFATDSSCSWPGR